MYPISVQVSGTAMASAHRNSGKTEKKPNDFQNTQENFRFETEI